MKWFISKWTCLLLCLLFTNGAEARQPVQDSLKQRQLRDSIRELRRQLHFERRRENYREGWQKLIPKYQKLQYAGSIGFLSIGLGWDYGKQHQWETDLLWGFVPRFSSDETKLTFTVKQNYIPWRIALHERWNLEPLTAGLLMNTVLDDDFWKSEPDKYPNGYYNFSTKVRFHVFLGQRISFGLKRAAPFKRITFYYELSSCDLYIISIATNKYLNLSDLLSLSFGVKLQIL